MLARESNANYPSRRREMTNYTLREVKKVCAQIGPRESGEESERKAQAYVAESMKNVADTVETEEFELHPKAFVGWELIDVILMTVSAVLLALSRIGAFGQAQMPLTAAATVLTILSIVFFIAEFLLYKPLLDPLFPKRRSCNVVCTRKASGETKRRIIFSGHIDSAYECTYRRLGGNKLLKAVSVLAFAGIFLQLVLDILSFFPVSDTLSTVILVLAVVSALPIWLVAFLANRKFVVPGANDDLTGVFASMAVLHYMAANDIRFENTEVTAVSMGCSEAGLRGAKAFAEKHANADGVETVFVAVDTLHDFEHLCVCNRDMHGRVKLDADASALLKKASEIAEHNLDCQKFPFEASDAAALAQGGMKAVTLAATDPASAQYHHTRDDKANNLNPKTVEAGIDILLETAFLFDSEGLKGNY